MERAISPNNMEAYHNISDDVSISRVQRQVQQFAMRQSFYQPEKGAEQRMYGLKLESFYDDIAQRMILELRAKVASKKFAVKTVRFPDGAWQAIRHAVYGSGWMMYKFIRDHFAKHPVRYVEVTMEANAYHPDIAIPDHDTFVDIAMHVRRSGKYT